METDKISVKSDLDTSICEMKTTSNSNIDSTEVNTTENVSQNPENVINNETDKDQEKLYDKKDDETDGKNVAAMIESNSDIDVTVNHRAGGDNSEKNRCETDGTSDEKSIDSSNVSTISSSQQSSAIAEETNNTSATVGHTEVVVKVEPVDSELEQSKRDVYRTVIDSGSSTDSDSSSDDSEPEPGEEESNKTDKNGGKLTDKNKTESAEKTTDSLNVEVIKTKGELFPEELPPLEELKITIDPNVELVHTGNVTSIVGILAIIQSNKNIPALNEDTILFLEGRAVMGQIFEVFGPVGTPWYSVRFNSLDDIEKLKIQVGTQVFCAPKVEEYTNYVFVEHLKQIRGSDASWEDNNEPPSKYLEFSDDEEEKRYKNKLRNKDKEEDDGQVLPGARKVRRRKNQETFVKKEKTHPEVGYNKKHSNGHQDGHMRNQYFENPHQNHPGRFNVPTGPQYQTFQPFGPSPRFQARIPTGPQMSQQSGGPLRPSSFTTQRQQRPFNNSNQQCQWNSQFQNFQGNTNNFSQHNGFHENMNGQQMPNQHSNSHYNFQQPNFNNVQFDMGARHSFGQQNFPQFSMMAPQRPRNTLQTGRFPMNRTFPSPVGNNQRLVDNRLIQNGQYETPNNTRF